MPSLGLIERVALARRRWGLSPRQTHVLHWLVTGATNKEIAQRIERSEVTVENHVTQLYRRSGARSRVDLVGKLFTLGAP
jgi:DNA-binding NarL/FixJ family response regulator